MSGSSGGIADAPCRSAGSCIRTMDSNIWIGAVRTFPAQHNALEASRVVMCGQGLKPSSPSSPALRSPSLHKPEKGLERAQGRAWGEARPDQAL